jgi:hypothetical protein
MKKKEKRKEIINQYLPLFEKEIIECEALLNSTVTVSTPEQQDQILNAFISMLSLYTNFMEFIPAFKRREHEKKLKVIGQTFRKLNVVEPINED